MIKVKELVEELLKLDQEQNIKVACDEEWNTIFCDIDIQQDGEHGAFVIFGLSGSEEESWQDVADGKFDREQIKSEHELKNGYNGFLVDNDGNEYRHYNGEAIPNVK